MRHPIPSRLAAGAAAAGLALVLSACSGGSSESEQPAEQNGSAAEQTSAPADDALTQLKEDELADVLNGFTHDGKSFSVVDGQPPEMQDIIERFEQADIEPAACKDVFIELMTKPSADAPNAAAVRATRQRSPRSRPPMTPPRRCRTSSTRTPPARTSR